MQILLTVFLLISEDGVILSGGMKLISSTPKLVFPCPDPN